MDWVTHQLDLAIAVLAELSQFPRRQVFRLDRFPNDLVGYRGASSFDFYHNRYRRYPVAARLNEAQFVNTTNEALGNAATVQC